MVAFGAVRSFNRVGEDSQDVCQFRASVFAVDCVDCGADAYVDRNVGSVAVSTIGMTSVRDGSTA